MTGGPARRSFSPYALTARSVEIEWRGFGGDRYTDAVLGWGGKFSKSLITPLVQRERAMAELFGGRS